MEHVHVSVRWRVDNAVVLGAAVGLRVSLVPQEVTVCILNLTTMCCLLGYVVVVLYERLL